MKNLIYIFSVMFLALFSCQEDILEQSIENKDSGDFAVVNFSLTVPDYSVKTKTAADGVSSLSLMTFDEENVFLGKVDVSADLTSGTARVPKATKYIHFICNYNWSGFNEEANKGKNEGEVIAPLVTGELAFWGRAEVSDFNQMVSVSLCHNYAKVTVGVDAGVQGFTIGGYGVYHYASKGTVAPYNENGDNTFDRNDNEVLTLPVSMKYSEGSDFDTNEKYLFESPNTSDNTTYVIIQNGSNGRYYKIHLLNSEKKAYKIERNFNYGIIIKGFTGGSNSGAESLEDAKKSAPSNDLYAEILKESPIISDANGNRLVVDKLIHLFTSSSNLSVQANYYPNGLSTANNTDMNVSILEDQGNILSNLNITNGLITAKVAHVEKGSQTAKIRVSKGVLSREITVIASEMYTFNPYTPLIYYAGKDQKIDLSFTIPSDYPSFPVECKIHATKLYPVGDDQNMLIVYEDNTYYYIYEAVSSGPQTVSFKTSVDNSNGIVTIENENFQTANINVKSTKDFPINGSASYYHSGNWGSYWSSVGKNSQISYRIAGGKSGNISIMDDEGSYSMASSILEKVDDNATITFSYKNSKDYTVSMSVSDYKKNPNINLLPAMTGSIEYGYYWGWSWESEGYPPTVSCLNGSMPCSNGKYTYTYYGNPSKGMTVNITYNKNGNTYRANPSIEDLAEGSDIRLAR